MDGKYTKETWLTAIVPTFFLVANSAIRVFFLV